jgi:excinuclease UvrABC ATPase subunit
MGRSPRGPFAYRPSPWARNLKQLARRQDLAAELCRQDQQVFVPRHQKVCLAHLDWVIDLGPEGGVKGGAVVAGCPPEELVRHARSHTGAALRAVLARV